jgi:hypothetical protein
MLYLIKQSICCSTVGTETRYGLDGPGIEYQWERDFPLQSLTVPGARPPRLLTMGTGSYPEVNRPGRGVNYLTPFSVEVKKRIELHGIPLLLVRAFVVCYIHIIRYVFTLHLLLCAEHTLSVLFVFICVMYCCHRVSTQLRLNIYIYHIISYHIISYVFCGFRLWQLSKNIYQSTWRNIPDDLNLQHAEYFYQRELSITQASWSPMFSKSANR